MTFFTFFCSLVIFIWCSLYFVFFTLGTLGIATAIMIDGALTFPIPPLAYLPLRHLPALLHLAGVGQLAQVFIIS
jgi:bacteriorhodopsin